MIQCHGSTHFHYQMKRQEVTLSCETCQWEADVNSDNRVDCSLSKTGKSNKSECPAGTPELCNEIKYSSDGCQIVVKRGFFTCVRNIEDKACSVHPFKPSAHHVESFIVAQEEPDMVSNNIMESSVHVSAGGSINLTCKFTIKGSYSNQPFVVYWIKTAAESSTYLLLKRTNTSHPSLIHTNTHNLTISNAAHSDSGQYVCALQVNDTKKQLHWRVITNTTVTVDDPVNPDVYAEDNPTTTGTTTVGTFLKAESAHETLLTPGDDSAGVYVAGIVVPIILIVIVVIILLKRRSAGTKVPQTVIFQSNQHGKDGDDDCSPYAVSQREQEHQYSVLQLPEQNTDRSTGLQKHKIIMKNNSIYEASGPS
ncbi:uncharacterized protein LOC134069087 [Sardina pilchardus]|uniref:uncharacterized protein LOC134069087 n=1 Tax=Sardina pilchardus TaxID=27697 RepID=UPI002E0ECF02